MQKVCYTLAVFHRTKGVKSSVKRNLKRGCLAALILCVCAALCSCSFSLEGMLTKIKNYVNGEEGEVIPPDFVESRESGDYAYDAYLTYAVITGYLGEQTHVNVPATLDGLPVKRIGALAFYDGVKVESVVLPEGIEALDDNAFYYCSAMTSVSLPSTLTVMGEKSFSWCGALTSVDLPAGITAIPDFCFNQCVSLKTVSFAGKVRTVGARAFSGCAELRAVDFGGDLLSLGDYAFRGDTALVYVVLPGGCNLGAEAFSGCDASFTVVTPAGSACALSCEQMGVLIAAEAPELPDEPEESSEESAVSDIILE